MVLLDSLPMRSTGADQLVVVMKLGNASGAKALSCPVEVRSQLERGGADD